jgi:hypothetical protein
MRRDAALQHLEAHPHLWIRVSSDQTLEAIRELQGDGHRVVTRKNDEGWEVRYTPPDEVVTPGCPHPPGSWKETESGTVCTDCGEVVHEKVFSPGMAGRENPLKRIVDEETGKERFEVSEQTCEECGSPYIIRAQHVRFSERHKQWEKGHLDPEIPVPPQPPTYAFPLDHDLSGLVFGEVLICPRCKGTHLKRKGVVDAACMERDGKQRCIRCNGHGLIPNMGPVSGGTFSLGTKEFRSDA